MRFNDRVEIIRSDLEEYDPISGCYEQGVVNIETVPCFIIHDAPNSENNTKVIYFQQPIPIFFYCYIKNKKYKVNNKKANNTIYFVERGVSVV